MKFLCLLVVALSLVGCQTQPVSSLNTTASYDQNDQIWSVSVSITFKTVPDSVVVAALTQAGASPVKNGLVWVFPPGMKPSDSKVMSAIGQAATVDGGYTLAPIK